MTRSYRRKEYRIIVRSIKKDPPDPAEYARVLIRSAMEQHGLTPSWKQPSFDSLLSQYYLDDRPNGAQKSSADKQ